MPDTMHKIEVGSIYGYHSKEGLVELQIDGIKVQMDIRKTREVIGFLQEAAEAAISDQLLMEFLQTRIGLSLEAAGAALLDFRELRQGSRRTVFVQ